MFVSYSQKVLTLKLPVIQPWKVQMKVLTVQ